MYSVEDLSAILKLHPKTVLRFLQEGRILGRKIGRSWRVDEEGLKTFLHGELAQGGRTEGKTDYSTLGERITVSAVVEVSEQDSEEASRISNSLLAILSSKDPAWGETRFDFFHYPESRRSKYVIHGSPGFIATLMKMFDLLSQQKEES